MNELHSKLKEVLEKFNAAKGKVGNVASPFHESEDRSRVEDFNASSFLLIRSFEGDQGVRKIDGPTIRYSSGIKILSSSRRIDYFYASGAASKNYSIFTHKVNFSIEVHNLGGLDVPSAKISVEVYLRDQGENSATDFLASFKETRASWISSDSKEEFVFDVELMHEIDSVDEDAFPVTELVILARAYSFSPQDFKVGDLDVYEPNLDRRDAVAILEVRK